MFLCPSVHPSVYVHLSFRTFCPIACLSVGLLEALLEKFIRFFVSGLLSFISAQAPFAHHLATDRIHLYIHKPVCLSVHQSFSRLGSPLSSSPSPQLLKNRCMNWSLIYRFTHAYNRLSEKPIESHTLRG